MIGQWVKESREAKGLSQNQLAELMNTTRQCISHYENGRRQSPSLEVLKEFSRVLDLNILIEKGEVIKMKREIGVAQTIEAVRERLEQQFKYTHRISVGEFIGQVVSLVEDEFKVDFIGWRGFLPNVFDEVENLKDEDWISYFSQPYWGRFEFDIELDEGTYLQGITFSIEDREYFAELMMSFLPETDEEWERFSDTDIWLDVVHRAIYSSSEIEQLMISDIKIEQSIEQW